VSEENEIPTAISLADLKSKRAAMDRAPWSFDVPEPPAGSVDLSGADCRCDDADDTTDPPSAVLCPRHEHVAEWVTLPNAAGIVATHGAADALIEVAEAALAWRAAIDEREGFGARAYRDDPYRIATPAHRAVVARLDRKISERASAFWSVLARVTL
jgi:hypothetical protein